MPDAWRRGKKGARGGPDRAAHGKYRVERRLAVFSTEWAMDVWTSKRIFTRWRQNPCSHWFFNLPEGFPVGGFSTANPLTGEIFGASFRIR